VRVIFTKEKGWHAKRPSVMFALVAPTATLKGFDFRKLPSRLAVELVEAATCSSRNPPPKVRI
jgi:hypothetical protein